MWDDIGAFMGNFLKSMMPASGVATAPAVSPPPAPPDQPMPQQGPTYWGTVGKQMLGGQGLLTSMLQSAFAEPSLRRDWEWQQKQIPGQAQMLSDLSGGKIKLPQAMAAIQADPTLASKVMLEELKPSAAQKEIWDPKRGVFINPLTHQVSNVPNLPSLPTTAKTPSSAQALLIQAIQTGDPKLMAQAKQALAIENQNRVAYQQQIQPLEIGRSLAVGRGMAGIKEGEPSTMLENTARSVTTARNIDTLKAAAYDKLNPGLKGMLAGITGDRGRTIASMSTVKDKKTGQVIGFGVDTPSGRMMIPVQ